MNKTLAVIVAAAGIAGCASAPHYQSEIMNQEPSEMLNSGQNGTAGAEQQEYAKYILSDNKDRLALGYAKMDVASIYDTDKTEWLRVEADRACLLERIYEEYGTQWLFISDDGCDGIFDRIFTNVNPANEIRYYVRSDFTEDYALKLDEAFAGDRDFMDTEFDIDKQIEEWHKKHE
ncbi:MAG: hypothetical protein V1734_03330 [Nanoarchaeota archaeon]